MRYRILFLLIVLKCSLLFTQSNPYRGKIFIPGKDYFWDIVFNGWNGKLYDWSLMQKVYVYDDSSRGFQEYLDLLGPCQKVAHNVTGDKLALIVVVPTAGTDVGAHHLQILDSTGKKVIEIANVYDFEWLHSNDTVVYLTGKHSETNEIRGFSPTGTWILDLKTKTSHKIAELGYWLFIDESSETIYIDHYWKVSAYDYSKGSLLETNLKGNRFSPSRKYYYRTPGGYWPFMIYETATNKPVKITAIDTTVQFVQWVPSMEHVVILGDYHAEKKIIDIESGRMLSSISGTVLGFNERTKEFLVHRNKRYLKAISESKLEWMKIQ